MNPKHVTIVIPVDVYARVKKLAPQKKWEANNIQEFHTQIFLDGLEHPRFVKKEHQLAIRKLEIEKSIVQGQLTAAQKKLPSTNQPTSAAVSNVAEMLARTLQGLPNPRPPAEASAPAPTSTATATVTREPVEQPRAPE